MWWKSTKKTVDLFVVKLKDQDYPIWLSNLYTGFDKTMQGTPEIDDCFIKHIIIEKGNYCQSGGMGICGKYLAIPISGSNGSKINFYDISNPTEPQKIGHSIRRKNSLESCSVAMTRLECGNFLVAIWSDMYGLYFYLSKGTTLQSKFKEIYNSRKFKLTYRGISLVQDFNNNIYLIGTQNLSPDAPRTCLKNIADLFLINIEKDQTINVDPIERKIFPSLKTSNFNAACSFYIADSGSLCVYSCHNYLCENNPKNCEQLCDNVTSKNPNLFITFDQYGVINNSLE